MKKLYRPAPKKRNSYLRADEMNLERENIPNKKILLEFSILNQMWAVSAVHLRREKCDSCASNRKWRGPSYRGGWSVREKPGEKTKQVEKIDLFPLHLEFPLPQPHRPSPTSQVVTV
jgi:hypothetical protein